jgi:hypothetical protein
MRTYSYTLSLRALPHEVVAHIYFIIIIGASYHGSNTLPVIYYFTIPLAELRLLALKVLHQNCLSSRQHI